MPADAPVALERCRAGLSAETIGEALCRYAKYPVPQNVLADVRELARRWGRRNEGSFSEDRQPLGKVA